MVYFHILYFWIKVGNAVKIIDLRSTVVSLCVHKWYKHIILKNENALSSHIALHCSVPYIRGQKKMKM